MVASLPSFADPEVTRYMTDLAAAMDDRRQRLGEHTAQEPRCGPPLGRHQVPGDDSHVAATVTGNTVVLAGHVRTRAQRDAVAGAAWLGHGVSWPSSTKVEITG
jgi:class 3 adenylate cyclase